MGLLFRFASRFVAGETMDAAVERAVEVNSRGMHAILNFLGEHYTDMSRVKHGLEEYRQSIARIRSESLDASISVKLTQAGLDVSEEACVQTMDELVGVAVDTGVFLWLDMESSAYTDATIRIYRRLLHTTDQVGVCLQANLLRTVGDLPELAKDGGVIRLVKGAYREPKDIALTEKPAVDENYGRLLDLLFRTGRKFAVASHDRRFVDRALHLSDSYERDFEFQMLLGVRDPLKDDLVRRGHRVAEYIPYGPYWLPYFSRRLRERPRNLITMFRSLLDVGN